MGEIAIDNQIQEMERIFRLQKKSQWKLKNTTAKERIELLKKLRNSLENNREEIDEALLKDLGRPKTSSELEGVFKKLDHTIEHLEEWMKPEIHSHSQIKTATYYIHYEPRGVCLLLGAWNVPVDLVFSPLIALISAGNTVIAKPSELVPNCSKVIARVIKDTFNEEVVAVIEGDAHVATELQELPFDHIFFTGSPNIGRMVMKAAAKHLTSVTLELGGCNPLILDETANIQSVAQGIGVSKTYNSGQVCLSVNYVYAPKSKVNDLIQELSNFYTTNFYENNHYQADRVGKIVNEKNFDRVVGYISDAIDKGAEVVFGGGYDRTALTIEPTILRNVPLDSQLIENEIFAPIIPIVTYDDLNEVIDHVNAGGKPLGMYIFSNNQEFIDKILNNTSCGGVTLNSWALHGSEHHLPFGGVNESGMGSYHGIHGFKELSHAKSIFKTY